MQSCSGIGLSEETLHRIDDVFDGIPMSAETTGTLQLQRLRETISTLAKPGPDR